MNQICLIGRLTKNPELRYTNNNKPVANFTIAVNRVGQDGADFINCVVWNTPAEKLCKYQEKGSQIAIVGNLRVEQYQDSNGDNRYKTFVLANSIQYLGGRKEVIESTTEPQQSPTEEKEDPFAEFGEEINMDDLPF